MKKLKQYFKNILGITALENKIQLQDQEIKNLQRPNELLAELSYRISHVENLKRYFKIGLDVSPRGGESWAVICCAGKTELITFADLNGLDMYEIRRFLQQFQLDERNVIIDGPFRREHRKNIIPW